MSFSVGVAFCVVFVLIVLVIACLAYMAYLLIKEVMYVWSWRENDYWSAKKDRPERS
jgi:hypothetical protein